MAGSTRALALHSVRDHLAIWAIVLLISGQGIRYLVSIPIFVGIAVATLVAVFLAYRPTWRQLTPQVLLGSFVGLAAASVLWSATRTVTLIASVTLIATTALALTIVRSTTIGRFMGMLYRGFQISLFIGIAFEMIVAFVIREPIEPISRDLFSLAGDHFLGSPLWSENNLLTGGYIQGFVGNRNPFGAIALFTFIGVIILFLDGRIGRIDAFGTGIASVFVLYMTQSATVTVATVYVMGLLLAGLVIRSSRPAWKRTLSFAVLGLTAMAAVVTLRFRAQIFDLLDRSPDATNRGDIWQAMLEFATQRPEGWGYVAYWPVFSDPYASIIERVGAYVAPHGHNAFFDAWLQLGLVGVALLLTLVVLTFLGAWRLVERAHRGDSFIPLGWALMTAVLALQGLTESRLLSEWGWFLLVSLYCSAPGAFTLTVISEDMVRTGDRTPWGEREQGSVWPARPAR
ncbi:MAG: O-antigen ligase family protein [Ruaniaceae bacterium]|nr:O-antigen ligase family protein [Ruaniaceae bacterium]